jgi:glycosyltransferase involved in cell wall biosynthesis
MILLVHKNEKVLRVMDLNSNQNLEFTSKKPFATFFELAKQYQDRILVWCDERAESHINFEAIEQVFKLKNTLLSYSNASYISKEIGYIEDSPFIKVKKNIRHSSWLVSSVLGCIHNSQLIKFESIIDKNEGLDFGLNSMAKLGMSRGLFCYSEPSLVKRIIDFESAKISTFKLFKFVKMHYKPIWGFLLLVNLFVNENRFPVLSFLRTLFVKKLDADLDFDLQPINKLTPVKKDSIDLIVPTLGRKKHLYNFLKDLEKQTYDLNQVIIIEQNDDKNSVSELDFLQKEAWSFSVVHQFTHQTGACNARNIALDLVDADYVFLADDDIRIDSDFFETVLGKMKHLGLYAVTLSCLGENDVKSLNTAVQWGAFGSGCSVVKANRLKGLKFDMRFEFGYGEDVDFGMQLRNKGVDIIYLPFPEIKHLKAPIGGFRTKFKHPWEGGALLPKPSPTVMLNRMKNSTKEQLLGYKTVLFLKYYTQQSIKNPFKYILVFKKQWRLSKMWANRLNEAF